MADIMIGTRFIIGVLSIWQCAVAGIYAGRGNCDRATYSMTWAILSAQVACHA